MGETLDAICAMLQTALGGKFKAYRVGRPDLIGKTEMPFVCVYPRSTENVRSGTGNDDARFNVAVRVVMDVKDMPNNAPGRVAAKLESQRSLIDAVEGRDAGLKPRPDTILGVLNNDITVGGLVQYTDNFTVAYDTDLTPEGTGTRETVTLNFTVHARPPWRG